MLFMVPPSKRRRIISDDEYEEEDNGNNDASEDRDASPESLKRQKRPEESHRPKTRSSSIKKSKAVVLRLAPESPTSPAKSKSSVKTSRSTCNTTTSPQKKRTAIHSSLPSKNTFKPSQSGIKTFLNPTLQTLNKSKKVSKVAFTQRLAEENDDKVESDCSESWSAEEEQLFRPRKQNNVKMTADQSNQTNISNGRRSSHPQPHFRCPV